MRRAFFFIVAIVFATSSFGSIPRTSMLDRASEDASASAASLPETRIRVVEDLAPFVRPAESELTRALRQTYEHPSTTNASGLRCFFSVDPVLDMKKALEAPQMWNRYTYVLNNPLRYVDPDGRQTAGADGSDPHDSGNGIFGSSSIVNVRKIDQIMMATLDKINDVGVNVMMMFAPIGASSGGRPRSSSLR